MVDLSKFDDDKLDPTFPTELDAQIISLLFDLPELAEQVLPHLKPTYFQGLEAQLVSAEILNHHASVTLPIDRPMVYKEVYKGPVYRFAQKISRRKSLTHNGL